MISSNFIKILFHADIVAIIVMLGHFLGTGRKFWYCKHRMAEVSFFLFFFFFHFARFFFCLLPLSGSVVCISLSGSKIYVKEWIYSVKNKNCGAQIFEGR